VWTARAVANLESFRVESTRRSHLRRDFRTDCNQHRRNTAHLTLALNRNDRAVADVRSTSRQHDGIGA
jgi:hypothetical protein